MDAPSRSDEGAAAADGGVGATEPPAPTTERSLPAPLARQRRRRTPRTALLIGAGTLLALLLGLSLWRLLAPRAQVTYVTAAVTRGAVAPFVTASGSVNPILTIEVGSYVSGVIQSISCDFNTQVKVGQLCAKIDPRPYQVVVDQNKAALAAAQAQLVKDQASLEYARVNYQRQALLVRENSASRDAADIAKSTLDQAQAQIGLDRATIAQRQANLKAAQVNLAYTNITSPVNGTVVARDVTQGQTVAASFQTPTLFLIATDLTQMQVDSSVDEADIGSVRTGDAATFTVEAFPTHLFQGQVVQVRQAPQTIQNVVTYDVVVNVDNRDLLLKPGMTANVRIVTARSPDALRVPVEALRYWPEAVPRPATRPEATQQLWVLRGGVPRAVPVAVGLTDDRYAQITHGALAPGEAVIIGEHRPERTSVGRGTPRPRAPLL